MCIAYLQQLGNSEYLVPVWPAEDQSSLSFTLSIPHSFWYVF